jgi:hypothetical protein
VHKNSRWKVRDCCKGEIKIEIASQLADAARRLWRRAPMRNGQSASVGVREIISATLVEGPLSFFGPRFGHDDEAIRRSKATRY